MLSEQIFILKRNLWDEVYQLSYRHHRPINNLDSHNLFIDQRFIKRHFRMCICTDGESKLVKVTISTDKLDGSIPIDVFYNRGYYMGTPYIQIYRDAKIAMFLTKDSYSSHYSESNNRFCYSSFLRQFKDIARMLKGDYVRNDREHHKLYLKIIPV